MESLVRAAGLQFHLDPDNTDEHGQVVVMVPGGTFLVCRFCEKGFDFCLAVARCLN